jgi:hypothetical protein
MADDLTRLLRRTTRAAEGFPIFLAAVFARYRAAERIDDGELARRLAIDPQQLDALALCRRPRPDRFAQDVTAIATRFGADAGALAAIVRQVDALGAFVGASSANQVVAARDADDEPPAPEGES